VQAGQRVLLESAQAVLPEQLVLEPRARQGRKVPQVNRHHSLISEQTRIKRVAIRAINICSGITRLKLTQLKSMLATSTKQMLMWMFS
jgi:hypothetical protein